MSRRRYPITCSMDVDQAVEILEQYGSDSDPVFYRGCETTPRDIEQNLTEHDVRASRVRVRYATGGGRWVEGTLRDMVFERMNLRVRRS